MTYYTKNFKLGLVGYPIDHSLSPKIHQESAKILKITATYDLFEFAEAEIPNFLKLFWKEGGTGFNITSPYKQIIANHISEKPCLPINTVYRGTDGWLGCSTDGQGFLNSLKRFKISCDDFDQFIILGSGGAVISILKELIHKVSKKKFYIFRRSLKNDFYFDSLPIKKNQITLHDFDPIKVKKITSKNKNQKTLMIQGTSAPFKGEYLENFRDVLNNFDGVFYELNYGKTSQLLNIARYKGIPCFDGKTMLLEQALISQKYWWGKSVNFESLVNQLNLKL